MGRERLIGSCVYCQLDLEPGTIKHVGSMQRIFLESFDGTSSGRVGATMPWPQGIDAEISDNIERTIWEKFVFLVGMSSTTTLMNSEIGPIRTDPEGREFLLSVFREVTARPRRAAWTCRRISDIASISLTTSRLR